MRTGEFLNYCWLESNNPEIGIATVQVHCPEILLNRYLAITAFDSGALGQLSTEEQHLGFCNQYGVTFSPLINQALLRSLPYTDFTEWYLSCETFDRRQFGGIERFVNYVPFALDAKLLSRGDLDIKFLSGITDRFWQQMSHLKADVYISEGTNFLFATSDQQLFTNCKMQIHHLEAKFQSNCNAS